MQKDGNGSTPLHYAAAGLLGALRRGSVCSQLLKANKGALYQVDNDGLYPIHVAAFVVASQDIALFLKA
jgi:ankyrin repeat protein